MLTINEKWYKFNYSLEKLSEESQNLLGTRPYNQEDGKLLDLPPPNNLIATNFEILPKDESLSARPQLVKQWTGLADLWFKKDDKFE